MLSNHHEGIRKQLPDICCNRYSFQAGKPEITFIYSYPSTKQARQQPREERRTALRMHSQRQVIQGLDNSQSNISQANWYAEILGSARWLHHCANFIVRTRSHRMSKDILGKTKAHNTVKRFC